MQELLGHASVETTRKYLGVVGDGLVQAVRAHSVRGLLATALAEGIPAPPAAAATEVGAGAEEPRSALGA